ncbi:MAG TPA: PH domain-containing protein [Cellulomonas sp.]
MSQPVAADGQRPFRPRLARAVTLTIAVVVVALTALLVAALTRVPAGDRTGIALVGLAVAWFCSREAAVVARPDDVGLTVRNLLVVRRLTWAQIVDVRFGEGRPWVQLDLDDGDTLAVMAIQRADGTTAQQEARRLATLVARHNATSQDD